ncbi:MAG: response regulator transcription factor [Chloroflexota bacterium]|nr:MAG: response regulator transcription factor [Chloroflexota bacterium]
MSITVFLADDHAVVRDGLRYMLEAQPDIEVIGDAADGREAVRLIAQLEPDVAIVDITMPELNGIDATLQIREVCPATKVIILSMHANTRHIARALQAGAQGYLVKESAGIEVVKAVHAVNDGHHYLSQAVSDAVIDDYVLQGRAAGKSSMAHGSMAHGSALESLSAREREVLQLVVEGKSSAEIAGILNLSPKTVESYRSRMMQKLEIGDLPTLVRFAIKQGLTPLE